MAAAGRERCGGGFRRQHAGQHRVMRALDARHIHEAGVAADQRAARERQLRHRLVAALGHRARAIGEPLAAVERVAHERMRLEALEFLERRQIRIRIIQMHDEPDRHQIVVEVIKERAAAGRIVERPSERSAAPDPFGASPARPATAPSGRVPNFCGSRPSARSNFAINCLPRLPRAPSANSVYFARNSMPRVKAVLRLAILADAHVAGGDAGNRAVVVVKHFGRGKARIDFDAERLGLASPASGRRCRASTMKLP